MKLKITETNLLSVIAANGGIPEKGISRGGRYWWTLLDLTTLKLVEIVDGKYQLTVAGKKKLASLPLLNGLDPRSKMAGIKKRK